jgi:hypothetical protein
MEKMQRVMRYLRVALMMAIVLGMLPHGATGVSAAALFQPSPGPVNGAVD